jgi:hypothetical protein
MLNKEQAVKVAPLVNSPQIWAGLEEYLLNLKELTVKGLAMAQSESELRQLQGKLVLLETLLSLKSNVEKVKSNNGI